VPQFLGSLPTIRSTYGLIMTGLAVRTTTILLGSSSSGSVICSFVLSPLDSLSLRRFEFRGFFIAKIPPTCFLFLGKIIK